MAGAFRPPASRTFPETAGGVSFLAARSLTAACVEDTFPEPEQLPPVCYLSLLELAPHSRHSYRGAFFAAQPAGDTRSPLR